MSNPNRRYIHRDVILSTVVTFILLWILKLVFVNTKYLDPMYQALSDFQFTDLYYSQYQKKHTAIDTNIVIVNLGNNDRNAIVQELEIIKAQQPKVIGLDVTFPDLKDPTIDSILKASLHDRIPIMMTKNIVYDDDEKAHSGAFRVESSNPYFGKQDNEGFGNFLAEDKQSIRYYTPFVDRGNERITSFTTKIVEAFSPPAYEKLLHRKKKTEVINYLTSSIPKIDVGDIYTGADLSFLKDKIVLMGYLGPDLSQKVFEDNHVTPLNKSYGGHSLPDMYGVEIHANIISMVLRDDYITEVPGWLTFIIAFIITALHMYLFIHLYVEVHTWFHLGAKVIQILSFGFFVFLSIMMFHLFRIKLEPTYILAGVVLSCDALYFYEGIVEFLQDYFNFQSYFKKPHH